MSNGVTGKWVTGKNFWGVTSVGNLFTKQAQQVMAFLQRYWTDNQAYVHVECQIFVLSLLVLMINWRTDIQYV